MKKFISAIAISAATLATTAAFAETAVVEQRALLSRFWNQDAIAASQSVAPSTNFTGITSVLRPETEGAWAGNFRGARVHEPSGH